MFNMEEVLSKRNQKFAMDHLLNKRDGCGIDGIHISEFKEYWEMNHELIEKKMRDGNYIPGIIRTHEIVNGHGKQRIISCLNVTDRFITRLLSQKMKRYIEPVFLSKSFAYQDNKGILQAVLQAKEFLENGNEIVVEIDLKNYFDSIQLDKMYKLISENISDSAVNSLIKSYLYCKMEVENQVIDKKIGLVQGNPISPILSNLYLHSFDTYMEQQNLNWIRFADNIYIFLRDNKMAIDIYSSFCTKLKEEYNLHINQKKSGIKNAFDITMLGYIFYKVNGIIEIRKKQYETRGIYTKWEQSTVQKTERECHIVQDGILNKKDYALLFENEEEKHHIPAGIIHNIITPAVKYSIYSISVLLDIGKFFMIKKSHYFVSIFL